MAGNVTTIAVKWSTEQIEKALNRVNTAGSVREALKADNPTALLKAVNFHYKKTIHRKLLRQMPLAPVE